RRICGEHHGPMRIPIPFLVAALSLAVAGCEPAPQVGKSITALVARAKAVNVHKDWTDKKLAFGLRLSAAAEERATHWVVYDAAYERIPYPNGDVSEFRGVCADEIVRAYRLLGVDLQKLVHEDMALAFQAYPKRWGLRGPDSNIDHRRVPN